MQGVSIKFETLYISAPDERGIDCVSARLERPMDRKWDGLTSGMRVMVKGNTQPLRGTEPRPLIKFADIVVPSADHSVRAAQGLNRFVR
jgi:hypothetical protein